MRGYLACVSRLTAEESLRSIYDARGEVKDRIRQLMFAKTGNRETSERIWRDMVIRETEAAIDAEVQ